MTESKTVAYLVNQYPHVSHSFIRREIRALEAHGQKVFRVTIRRPQVGLVDQDDIAEAKITQVILAGGILGLALACLGLAFRRPGKWFRALRLTLRFGRNSGKRLRSLIYFAEACKLVGWLEREKIGHLHAHFGTNPADVATLTQVLGGPPVSFTVHGPEEFDRPEAISLHEKIARASFVVAVSSFGRSQLFRWSRPEDWHKIQVVHCGVDSTFLQANPLPVPNTKTIVCVGRLSEQKGQLILLEAMATVAAKGVDFELVLAGDGPMRAQLEESIARNKLGSHVRITGWLSNAQVLAEMTSSRLVILPSFAEGLPVVLMEALALGRPVITTYVAGIPELVRDGQSGWLVPAGDPHLLADALIQGLQCPPDTLTEMGKTGALAVRARHDARIEGAKLLNILQQVGTESATTDTPNKFEGGSR